MSVLSEPSLCFVCLLAFMSYLKKKTLTMLLSEESSIYIMHLAIYFIHHWSLGQTKKLVEKGLARSWKMEEENKFPAF